MPTPAKRHVLFLLAWLLACPTLPAEEPNRNVLFGMPSPAKELTPERLKKQAGVAADLPIEETTLDGFFRSVPSEDKAKFQKLAQVLKEQLSGIKVYKLGEEAEKEVYIVGKTKDGRWAGLKTSVVET